MTGTPLGDLPRAVLFDWDNTLVDTWATIHDAMNTTLAAMGCPPWSMDETRDRVRKSLREAFPELFGDDWEHARDIFYARFREIHIETLVTRPGSEELIRVFAEKGVYLGVVSNKSGDHLRRESAYLGWDKYFGRVVGATDAARDKPAIDPVLLALGDSGVAPGPDVWFIGDTWIDMQCAHDSDCVAILVHENAPTAEEFGEFMPRTHFENCVVLAALVRNMK